MFCLVTSLLDIEEYPDAGPGVLLPGPVGMRDRHRPPSTTDMGEGQPVLRSKDPEGVIQEMWALFAVYQAICKIVGIAVNAAGIPQGEDQLPARAGRRDGHRRRLSPLTRPISPSPRSC